MILHHFTPARNLMSIARHGLDPKRSQGIIVATWLCAPSRAKWASDHTVGRHGDRQLLVVSVSIPRSWLMRRRRGLYTCDRVITPDRII